MCGLQHCHIRTWMTFPKKSYFRILSCCFSYMQVSFPNYSFCGIFLCYFSECNKSLDSQVIYFREFFFCSKWYNIDIPYFPEWASGINFKVLCAPLLIWDSIFLSAHLENNHFWPGIRNQALKRGITVYNTWAMFTTKEQNRMLISELCLVAIVTMDLNMCLSV